MSAQTPSNIIPFNGFEELDGNFTQVPNQVFELMPSLSGSEIKCLLYIVRHTLGFRTNTRTITLDEFEHGRKTKKRDRMDGGVGLGRETIANALKALAERAIITREIDLRDKARQKITYGLHRSENPTSDNQSENPTASVGKSDRSGRKSQPRSVKESKETKIEKSATVAAAPTSKKTKKDKPADPDNEAIKELIHAWKTASGTIDPAAYSKPIYRESAREMHHAGITPEDVQAYTLIECNSTYWRGKSVAFTVIAKGINAWKATQKTGAASGLSIFKTAEAS